MTARWDIFCKVIDNFGDIGVAWRLARTLAAEHDIAPRLWVDDLHALSRIFPPADPDLDVQVRAGVEVRRWASPFPGVAPGAVVVETFQCETPPGLVGRMARMSPKPRWINLDYLSAEDWVRSCHALPSPHPRHPLVKHFFFPGFMTGTGGLMRERGLLEERAAFVSDPRARETLWRDHGLGLPGGDELRVSLFCYDTAPAAALARVWADGPWPVCAIVPDTPAAHALRAELAEWSADGAILTRGRARLLFAGFTDQDRYDRLLWACDLNFVRGEDSFVRAQWARRPFVWNIYPQGENAHWIKLNAFLDLYCEGLDAPAAAALRDLWRAWNGLVRPAVLADAWMRFAGARETLARHGDGWALRMADLGSLSDNLVRFCSAPI